MNLVSKKSESREVEPTAVFESFGGSRGLWNYTFTNPLAVYEARSIEEVLTTLQLLEQETKAGRWAVLMLSYEAAPAFDAALKTHSLRDFPLAWAAVFDKPSDSQIKADGGVYRASSWESQITREEYANSIQKIHRRIESGDTYQVNYTFPLKCRFEGDAFSWYRDLGTMQEANFCAYLNLDRVKLLSLSPELFFERSGDALITRPMKGTMPRGRWEEEDQEQALKLSASIKNRAENLMIVDLLRNDLGKISKIGSVKVSNLFQVERYRTVLQMTSTIESVCRPDVGLFGTLQALFPCGSITGAPKIRTMEIIRELEPSPRQAYTGAIGLVKPGGDCIFNVAIRTIILDSQTREATFNVGGGITYDSTAEDEYDECILKANFLNQTWPEFEIFETMRLDAGNIFLLDHHVHRLKSSAKYFDYLFDEREIISTLNMISTNHQTGCWKVRLFLKRDGSFRSNVEEIQSEEERVLRVKFAAQPVDHKDIFLYHKTTNRSVYENTLKMAGNCDDVILWNEAGEVTESAYGNIVLEDAKGMWTPPRRCGLLSGTFRDELIASGRLQERVIDKEELLQCRSFYLINSVRKWMPAILTES
jgi:para-aminobenzoate synthetase / 4-amino-4-deoxychorismate lyase